MEIFFNFILFKYNLVPEVVKCQRCKKITIFIEKNLSNVPKYKNEIFCGKIYEDMENNETYQKSVYIANNMINTINFSKILSNIYDNSSLNILYYDEGINDRRNEIIYDSFYFEKVCNGTLLLITNLNSMILLIRELIINKSNSKFLLICTGSTCEKLMIFLQQNQYVFKNIFSIIAYNYNYQKYSYLINKYNVIKGIFALREAIIQYIIDEKSTSNIKYNIPELITYNNYNEKYIEFHKMISLQYGKLYQISSYLTAIRILEEYLISSNKTNDLDFQLLLKSLEVFSQGPRDYIKIINEYTANKSFYYLFNKWLNEIDPLAISKIAFFISGLQLSFKYLWKKIQKRI